MVNGDEKAYSSVMAALEDPCCYREFQKKCVAAGLMTSAVTSAAYGSAGLTLLVSGTAMLAGAYQVKQYCFALAKKEIEDLSKL